MNKSIDKHISGQMLVEILLIFGLFMMLLPALLTGLITSREGKPQQNQRLEGISHLKELENSIRSIRDKDWDLVSVNGTYHPEVSGSEWILPTGTQLQDGFTRTVEIGDVYRDVNGAITETGGTLDPSTKKVTLTTSWTEPYDSQTSSILYLSRYQNNTVVSQTSKVDFDNGTKNQVQTTESSGGEIILANNTKGKWCTPQFSSTVVSLPDGPPVAVEATSSSALTTSNNIFTALSPNDSNNYKLSYITIPQNVDPPAPTPMGTFTLNPALYSNPSYVPSDIGLNNSFRTNDIKYYTSTSGNLYALLATNNPDKEVIAVQIKNAGVDSYQDPVNKIYKYWTFFNTNIYSGVTTITYDTGFKSPTTNTADSGGDNNGYESNPNRAYTSDNSYAVDNNSGSNTGTNCTGSDKDKHRYYNFNFDISSEKTITGIEVRLDARADSTTGSPRICAQLSWDGGTTWTSAKTSNQLATNEATYTLGGSSDTWGRSWTLDQLNNANFRVRLIDIASNTNRDFSLDYLAVKVYSTGPSNDQSPFSYGASSITTLGNRGYVSSGGYLYVFDLSNIDSKSPSVGLDQIGCRIELDGYDCQPSAPNVLKYSAGQSGTTWSTSESTYNNCNNGGNVEIYADNDLYGVQVGNNNYIYVAVGAQIHPELDIVNATSVPDGVSSPTISNLSCGRISGGNSDWKRVGSLDFNSIPNTEEAANSVYASADGNRAYISSNGGIDANNDGLIDSKQLYVIDTEEKNNPHFLSGSPDTGPSSGYYYGAGANAQLYPRRSLTVFNGSRAVLVGTDGVSDSNNALEYQVLDITNEDAPAYCGGVDRNQGFNDLSYVVEADNDKFVYLVSNSGANEMRIIQGGPDGTYLDTGTYESSIMDIGTEVAFNRLSASVLLPAGTNIRYQVAATDPVAGSCIGATYNYVGPDGTVNTYLPATGGAIPMDNDGVGYENPARCVRYKAFLSTTMYDNTPSILDVLINFSQ